MPVLSFHSFQSTTHAQAIESTITQSDTSWPVVLEASKVSYRYDGLIYVNQEAGTVTLKGAFDQSSVLYICEKDCFHILYDVIVCNPSIDTYPITAGKDADIFVPAHVVNLGVCYE